MQQNVEAKNLQIQLPSTLQCSMELSKEKGASTWLSSLPIDDHGFALHKSAFRDALSLRYGWSLQNPPSHCTCGHPFNIDHALTCKTGGFPAIRHNEVRDITASLLTEVCHGVTIEPHLQSHLREKPCRTKQLLLRMEPASMLPCMDLGKPFQKGIC